MQTIISTKSRGQAGMVHFAIKGAPKDLAVGDTFRLSLFGDCGCAELVGRHWAAERGLYFLICYVPGGLLNHLLSLKGKWNNQDPKVYELKAQKWM